MIEIIQRVAPHYALLNYVFHGVSVLVASAFGAGIAFLFNNVLQKKARGDLEKTHLASLITNTCTLTDRLLGYKKALVGQREKECKLVRGILANQKKELKKNSGGGFISVEGYTFEYLFQVYQTAGISFHVDIKDFSFVSAYNPEVYCLILIIDSVLRDTSQVIKDLNGHIMALSKREEGNTHNELSILCSFTEDLLKIIDHSLYFLTMLSPLLIDMGKCRYKAFPIRFSKIPDNEKKYIPKEGLSTGWEILEEQSRALAASQEATDKNE